MCLCSKRTAIAVFVAAMMFPALASAVNITSESESQPYPGVTVVEGETSSPQTNFYAAFIELCHDYIHIDASASNSTQTSGQWASSQGAQLAVNGDFFRWGSDGMYVYGDAAGGGQRWPSIHTGRDSAYSSEWFYERYGWIAFGEDFVEYSNTEWIKERWDDFGADQGWMPKTVTKEIPEGTEALISGFPQLVVEGEPIECSSPTSSDCFPDRSDMRDRHPRTAMGLTEDRTTFILLVVDGRSSSSVGMYGTELADLMGQLGAHVAINLDGGGSSQMWVEGQGTINSPSDGSPRSVPNSWGVFAGSGGGLPRPPGSCDRMYEEVLYQSHLGDQQTHSDVDGNELADVCARGPEGVDCFLADGDGGFSERLEGPALVDDSGWKDPTNHSTLRMGDINGNGRADLCARANARIHCWLWNENDETEGIEGPELSNDAGYDDIRYFSTIRLADVTGDGRDDLCVRTPDDFRCHPSEGDGFGEPIIGPSLSDDSGWNRPRYYGTIRMGDVTGNGKADVCARWNAEFSCWESTGDGFAEDRIEGPEWSDEAGWGELEYWSTIHLVDLDGDGKADVCGRDADGIVCHLSTGDGFGPAIEGPNLADDSGWDDYSNYSTIRFGDVDGDGTMDLCARANAGMRCWLFDGEGFGERWEAGMADETGWYRERFFRTIRLADVTGDGRADLCARASAGIVCWPSTGDGFAEEPELGPEWSDDEGWTDPDYYTTIRLATPCPGAACDGDEDNGDENGDNGEVGNGDGDDVGPAPGDAGAGDDAGVGDDDVSGTDAGEGDHNGEDGDLETAACACGAVGMDGGRLGGAVLVVVLALVAIRYPRGRVGRGGTGHSDKP